MKMQRCDVPTPNPPENSITIICTIIFRNNFEKFDFTVYFEFQIKFQISNFGTLTRYRSGTTPLASDYLTAQ